MVFVLFFILFSLSSYGYAELSHIVLQDDKPVVLPQEHIPEVFTDAEWTKSWIKGRPIWLARTEGSVVGYLFLTHRVVDMVAYSGKPLQILVAVDAGGKIIYTKLMGHSEPILLVGIPEQVIHDFISQFEGRSLIQLLLSKSAGQPKVGLDAVSGATVTALVADHVILEASKLVAQSAGLVPVTIKKSISVINRTEILEWGQLLARGLLRHVRLGAAEIEGDTASDNADWLDLYYGLLNQPSLGVSLIGKEAYDGLIEANPNKDLLVLLNKGSYSFRGSGFVRGGIFDRLYLTQDLDVIRFRDSDYHYQFHLEVEGAPLISEKAIFSVPDSAFNGALPWELGVLVAVRTHDTPKSKKFIHVKAPFVLPNAYIKRPLFDTMSWFPEGPMTAVWSSKKLWICLYMALWTIVVLVFVFRRHVAANSSYLERIHFLVLCCSILLLGLGQKGQPSVVNVFTFFDVMKSGATWSIFFTEPFLFISWPMVMVTTFLWGRGPFCGWLCPYGAFLEILFIVKEKLLPQGWRTSYELSSCYHRWGKHLPSYLFFLLLTVSLFSIEAAEVLAEIEPFKTTWLIGASNRPWFLALYWVWLLVMGVFTIRFFCRYLCPLGGFLSLIAKFQIFKIPRRNFCTVCKICSKDCKTRAIDKKGRIDSRQCFGCLECINKMHDNYVCPPLRNEKLWKRYEEFESKGAA